MNVWKKKNMEFISAGRKRETRALFLIIPVLFIAVLTLIQGVRTLNGKDIQKATSEMSEEHLLQLADALKDGVAIIDGMPGVNGDSLLVLESLAGNNISIQQLEYESGHIVVTAVSLDYRGGSEYAKAMVDSGVFEHVSYDGFSAVNQGEDAGYRFRITVSLERGDR